MELCNVLSLNGYAVKRDLTTITVRTIGLYSYGELVAVNVALIGKGFKWYDIGMYSDKDIEHIDNENDLLVEINDFIDRAYNHKIKQEYDLYMKIRKNSLK